MVRALRRRIVGRFPDGTEHRDHLRPAGRPPFAARGGDGSGGGPFSKRIAYLRWYPQLRRNSSRMDCFDRDEALEYLYLSQVFPFRLSTQ